MNAVHKEEEREPHHLLLIIRINFESGISFLYVFFLLSFPVETPQYSSITSTCVIRKRKMHKTTWTRWTTVKRIRLRPSPKKNSTDVPNIGVCLEHSSPGTSWERNIVMRLVKQSVEGKDYITADIDLFIKAYNFKEDKEVITI